MLERHYIDNIPDDIDVEFLQNPKKKKAWVKMNTK